MTDHVTCVTGSGTEVFSKDPLIINLLETFYTSVNVTSYKDTSPFYILYISEILGTMTRYLWDL